MAIKDTRNKPRRLLVGFMAATAMLATAVTGLPIPATAQTQDRTEQETTATAGENAGVPGYWITVKERVYSWEEQRFIEVVAYYRPYRNAWLSALSRSSFEEAGGRRDYWYSAVNESKVQSAVQSVGYSTLYNYVRDQANVGAGGWQNNGVVLIDPSTGKILGHIPVSNSYDAAAKVAGIINQEAKVTLNTGTFNIKLSATSVLSSPIVLDLEGLGRPDLLAGPTWNVIPGRKLASTALRQFDLDGSGDYAWEWIGPKSGLLVWDADGKGNIKSGQQLFGHHTWGKKWKDGYEALATLDDNGDGQLLPTEFANLGIWRDANSNGISEEGEVKSLVAWGIESISIKAMRDPKGNAWAPQGFVRKMPDGKRKTLATWDWMAMGEAKPVEGTYVWVGKMGEKELGGYFNLYREGDEVRGLTVPTIGTYPLPGGVLLGFPITGKRNGETIKWSVPADGGTVTSEVTWENGGKHLYGKTRVDTKDLKTEYLWQADLVAGNPVPAARSASKAN
ncbi:MAG: hypothetical protein FJZ01_10485 [Candidatus Sericytochromatia bacterium]|nr:hypothetical protein [Candidatus Tanganyikabacteria bacterium]